MKRTKFNTLEVIGFISRFTLVKRAIGLCLTFILLSAGLSYSQLISKNPSDYPAGTVIPLTGAITLPAAHVKTTSVYTIPLLVSLPYTVTLGSFGGGCSEISSSQVISNIGNVVSVLVNKKCLTSDGNYSTFRFNITKSGVGAQSQDFTVPILRDSAKIVLTLDISGSMSLNVGGGTGTRIQALKDAVNLLVPKLEEFQQEGDSLGLTYYSSLVYQPSIVYFPKSFVKITSNNEPVLVNYASYKVQSDLTPRVPLQMTAMASGLLDAKDKLLRDKEKTPNTKRMVFLFASGQQDYGNLINPDGVSVNGTTDSLNTHATNPKDSITYITVSTTSAANVPPLMAAIAHRSNGVSLNVDGDLAEFEDFCNNQLCNFLSGGGQLLEVAARITNLTPLSSAVGVDVDQSLTLDFNEEVNVGTGSLYIKRYSDDSLFEQVDITSSKVTGSGTSTVTINPSGSFGSGERYYVLADAGAVVGRSGNPFAGVTSKGYWSFTVKDVLSPTVQLSSASSTVSQKEFSVSIAFSEEVHGFTGGDITVGNGAVKTLTTPDSTSFTGTVEATAEGEVIISIASSVAEDLAGNPNGASNELRVTYQPTTAPRNALDDEIRVYSLQGNIVISLLLFGSGRYAHATAEVYSVDGKLIKQKALNSSVNTIDTNHSVGACIVKVILKDEVYTKKIVIQ